ncbi:predicted protein [Lichtheimia corymbifera JMRC:FSU:9682]|uniref:Uncharacterized protein n=1 Tax=Lichtheimia corymbifera JMRC:FSU:9682 TaxID=1263082 RepID=A0A068S2C3_9FUNG|nr:predicted protein [Lichtheimia corymbifera JMRC:FSU:9682]
MKRGVFNQTKLLVGVKRTLGASFTINLDDPRFRNVTTSLVEKNSRGRPQVQLWLVVILRNLGSSRLIVELAPKVLSTLPSNLFY